MADPMQEHLYLERIADCKGPKPQSRKRVRGKDQQRRMTTTRYNGSCLTEGLSINCINTKVGKEASCIVSKPLKFSFLVA